LVGVTTQRRTDTEASSALPERAQWHPDREPDSGAGGEQATHDGRRAACRHYEDGTSDHGGDTGNDV
jgi:hypothetical protein